MLAPQASSKYLPIQRAEAIQLMNDIINTPQVCGDSLCLVLILLNLREGLLHPFQSIFNFCDFFNSLWQTLLTVRNERCNCFF